ncbi:acyltransferase [Pseudomonas koreensis]|uniref:acyltransferase family protein n=1 Tax=Pseudomonas koreensis TaxID=198620 RepID=UPI0021C5D2AE|nr:acyltransferase [Pseudomonas koreensis]MCU0075001.1 acyltransferase [Pseudomonas koreensis]
MNNSKKTNSDFYPNLDWLRLLLAIQVVAIHCGVAPTVFINPVPAFLAISGFVVLGSLERRSVGQFFIGRALRVLPLLFVSFIAIWVLYNPEEMLKNILYWLWPTGAVPVNNVAWSLIYEEAFYLLLAILFSLGVYRSKIGPILIFAAITFTTITLELKILNFTSYILGTSFFLGNIAYLYRHQIRQYVNPWVATAPLLLLTSYIYQMPYINIGWRPEIWIDIAAFLAMLIFAIAGPQLPRLTIDISYSLYLLHCLVRNELVYFIPTGARLFVFVMLAALPICYASWYLIEKPSMRLKGRLSELSLLKARLSAA